MPKHARQKLHLVVLLPSIGFFAPARQCALIPVRNSAYVSSSGLVSTHVPHTILSSSSVNGRKLGQHIGCAHLHQLKAQARVQAEHGALGDHPDGPLASRARCKGLPRQQT